MNMELYITILESGVSHLERLKNLLVAKNATHYCQGDSDCEEQIKNILQEILLTANKLEYSTRSINESTPPSKKA
ncbi:MAG: hypothetical protein IKF90_00625 [Parasporobacterium sp.]|nr:hypothetical protein [Parasporobacterium sp.]